MRREGVLTDRQEAGTKRGMNVARLQCDAMHAVHVRDFGLLDGRTEVRADCEGEKGERR